MDIQIKSFKRQLIRKEGRVIPYKWKFKCKGSHRQIKKKHQNYF
jgi:hypothetical protein